jgi:hypothetical protein
VSASRYGYLILIHTHEQDRGMCLTRVTLGVSSPARLASPPPHMADCRSCSVEC